MMRTASVLILGFLVETLHAELKVIKGPGGIRAPQERFNPLLHQKAFSQYHPPKPQQHHNPMPYSAPARAAPGRVAASVFKEPPVAEERASGRKNQDQDPSRRAMLAVGTAAFLADQAASVEVYLRPKPLFPRFPKSQYGIAGPALLAQSSPDVTSTFAAGVLIGFSVGSGVTFALVSFYRCVMNTGKESLMAT